MEGFESWLPKWQANGYKTAGGQAVKNLDLILYINILIDARRLSGQKVDLKYVRGHAGIVGNEAADALANQGTLMPPEPERHWKTLEEEVRRKLPATKDANIDFNVRPVLFSYCIENDKERL
jgi:ribonuclease HI